MPSLSLTRTLRPRSPATGADLNCWFPLLLHLSHSWSLVSPNTTRHPREGHWEQYGSALCHLSSGAFFIYPPPTGGSCIYRSRQFISLNPEGTLLGDQTRRGKHARACARDTDRHEHARVSIMAPRHTYANTLYFMCARVCHGCEFVVTRYKHVILTSSAKVQICIICHPIIHLCWTIYIMSDSQLWCHFPLIWNISFT